MMRPRPEPGAVFESEVRIRICRHCGYRLDEGGLCHYECPHDGERGDDDTITAVYKRTDVFLRDE